MLEDLADLLNGQLAVTRPLVENGWAEAKRQIGLSGKTVRPKLIYDMWCVWCNSICGRYE